MVDKPFELEGSKHVALLYSEKRMVLTERCDQSDTLSIELAKGTIYVSFIQYNLKCERPSNSRV